MILEFKYNWTVEIDIKKKKKKKSRYTQDDLEKQDTLIRNLQLIGNHS